MAVLHKGKPSMLQAELEPIAPLQQQSLSPKLPKPRGICHVLPARLCMALSNCEELHPVVAQLHEPI